LFHVPPKSPKLDAADAVFAVVKLKSKPSVVMCWHAPSISIELPRKDCPPTALVSSSDDPPLVSSMDVPRMVFGVPASTRHAGDDPSTLQTISEDPTSQRGTAGRIRRVATTRRSYSVLRRAVSRFASDCGAAAMLKLRLEFDRFTAHIHGVYSPIRIHSKSRVSTSRGARCEKGIIPTCASSAISTFSRWR